MSEHKYHFMTAMHQADALIVSVTEPRLRDAAQCYGLRDEIVTAIDSAPIEKLILDLSAVEFIGSIGFLAFLSARRHLDGGKVILCGMSEGVQEMFRVCGLTSASPDKTTPFEQIDTVQSALAID